MILRYATLILSRSISGKITLLAHLVIGRLHTRLGPEAVRVDIKNAPISKEHIKDIDGVSYTLAGDILIFYQAYPTYEAATVQEYQIRPDLLKI